LAGKKVAVEKEETPHVEKTESVPVTANWLKY
jgi:hypothetical protein